MSSQKKAYGTSTNYVEVVRTTSRTSSLAALPHSHHQPSQVPDSSFPTNLRARETICSWQLHQLHQPRLRPTHALAPRQGSYQSCVGRILDGIITGATNSMTSQEGGYPSVRCTVTFVRKLSRLFRGATCSKLIRRMTGATSRSGMVGPRLTVMTRPTQRNMWKLTAYRRTRCRYSELLPDESKLLQPSTTRGQPGYA